MSLQFDETINTQLNKNMSNNRKIIWALIAFEVLTIVSALILN